MCLTTKSVYCPPDFREKQEEHIDSKLKNVATEDMPVLKLLKKNVHVDTVVYQSPFFGMVYEPNKTHGAFIYKILEVTAFFKNELFFNIEQGLHSYTLEGVPEGITGRLGINYIIAKMIIPKGSVYYKSDDGKEMVSNQLYWDGSLKEN